MGQHFRTADNSQSYCEEYDEFDVIMSGGTVTRGPEPTDYCGACYAAEPEWTVLSEEEFLKRWPL